MAEYTRYTDFAQGTTIVADDVDAEFNRIATAVNNIDTNQITDGAVTTSKLAASLDPTIRTKETVGSLVVSGLGFTTFVATSNANRGKHNGAWVNRDEVIKAGTAYVQGVRVVVSGATSKTFDASQTTWVVLDTDGVFTFPTGTSTPALSTNKMIIAKVVTDSTKIIQYIPLGYDLVGSILPFMGYTPMGYLLCDGSNYKTADYEKLYNVIGVSSGTPATDEFNVPDLRGNFLRGTDNNVGTDPDRASRTAPRTGANAGDLFGSLQGDQYRSHLHYLESPYTTGAGTIKNGSGIPPHNGISGGTQQGGCANAGGNETRPRNIGVNFIIRAI